MGSRPAVFDCNAHGVGACGHEDAHRAPVSRVAARVVHEDPAQAVHPGGRRLYQDRIGSFSTYRKVDAPCFGDCGKPLHATLCDGAEVDRLVTRNRRIGVEPGQEQEVFDNAAQPFALRPDPAQGAAIANAVPRTS